MKMSRTVTILGLLLSLALLAGVAAWAAEMPAEGSMAPDFTLPSQEGKQISLHDFKGKWVVLYFYPKDMTPGCTIEAHNFQRDQAQYDKLNAAVVGVSADNVDSHVQFCTKENLTFKLLADPEHNVIDKYGSVMKMGQMTVAARNTFLVDPSGKIRKVYVNVSPHVNMHSEEVLMELAQLKK
ncbi:MAG TPA: peroxiredoxin [Bryobacteraceae bacterium]|nr:peroxiredoxin [Bryobacteraceae bacterium]